MINTIKEFSFNIKDNYRSNKKLIKNASISIFIFLLLELVLPFSILIPNKSLAGVNIETPYDWTKTTRLKGNLHAHTNYGPDSLTDGQSGSTKINGVPVYCANDDGVETPKSTANWYASHGFGFYALTGHVDLHNTKNTATGLQTCWGYSKNSPVTADGMQKANLTKVKQTIVGSDPGVSATWMGVSLEQGMFPNGPGDWSIGSSWTYNGSQNQAHVGMINLDNSLLNSSLSNTAVSPFKSSPLYSKMLVDGPAGTQNAINEVADNGLVILHHPLDSTNKSTTQAAAGMVAQKNNVTGIEVINGTFGYPNRKKMINFWDAKLKEGKKLWAFGSDDAEEVLQRGKAFIVVNTNNKSKNEIISQIKKGNFIVSTPNYNIGPDSFYDIKVNVDKARNLITATTDATKIKIVIGGITSNYNKEVVVNSKNATYYVTGKERYVRFEAYYGSTTDPLSLDSAPVALSQPVYVSVTQNPIPVASTSSPEQEVNTSKSSETVNSTVASPENQKSVVTGISGSKAVESDGNKGEKGFLNLKIPGVNTSIVKKNTNIFYQIGRSLLSYLPLVQIQNLIEFVQLFSKIDNYQVLSDVIPLILSETASQF